MPRITTITTRRLLILLGLWFCLTGVAAAETYAGKPVVSLIIDDMGDKWDEARAALALPGAVTYSILPHTPYAAQIARAAHNQGDEVMLHQPMQAQNGKAMGPGGLSLAMSREAFLRTLRRNLASLKYVSGVNNHMGSLLTRHPGHMKWLMEELARNEGLYFIDSRTTGKTVALQMARESRLAVSRRDVFLDHDPDPAAIRRQFERGIARARSHGSAILIGHPYPSTLKVLKRLLPTLKTRGVQLLPVSQTIRIQQHRSPELWQASLSPLQKAAKSSKQ